MCDFCSWMKKGNKVYYLTDDIIEAKWGAVLTEEFQNHIGHRSIQAYFGTEVEDLDHAEGVLKVPRPIARDINAGKMRKMAEASDPPYQNLRYSRKGDLISIDGVTFADFEAAYMGARKELEKSGEASYEPHNDYGLEVGDKVIIRAHLLEGMDTRQISREHLREMWVRMYRYAKKGYTSALLDEDRINWHYNMDKYIGKEATVTKIFEEDGYGYSICQLNIDRGTWSWHCGALEKVE